MEKIVRRLKSSQQELFKPILYIMGKEGRKEGSIVLITLW
jgi:hypothetical protein